MTICVAPLTIHDYDGVMALWSESKGVGLSDADDRENILAYLERNPGMSFLARDERGAVIGAVLCGHDGRRGYIHHLAVHPAHGHEGIGRDLVEKCLATLKAAGIRKCHLFIFNENQSGIRFWEEIGWETRFDLRVMSKTIS